MATVAKPTGPLRQIGAPPMVPRIAPREDLNPFRIAQIQFDMAAEFLKLEPGLRQILRTPKRVLEVSVPTKMDNGQVKVFTGYRVQHNVSRGPGKGGGRAGKIPRDALGQAGREGSAGESRGYAAHGPVRAEHCKILRPDDGRRCVAASA